MAKNDIWITRAGKRLKMSEMLDDHLKNAINYFKPYKDQSPKRWKLLKTEQRRRNRNKIPEDPIESRFDILDL